MATKYRGNGSVKNLNGDEGNQWRQWRKSNNGEAAKMAAWRQRRQAAKINNKTRGSEMAKIMATASKESVEENSAEDEGEVAKWRAE
jgi:hypothetical protein